MDTLGTPSNPGMALTGISGLDHILSGGFRRDRLYLIEGVPGSGKTTLALQFLLEGAAKGESVLYITLGETEAELREVAESHGWDLSGVVIHETAPGIDGLNPEDQYTMFHPSEVELGDTTRLILADVEKLKPTRVVFDSMSELRLLAGNALRYRRQILALKQFFSGRKCTVLLLDDMTSAAHDLQVQSIAHGVVRLDQLNPEYGAERRRLTVIKYRGVSYRGGNHDYVIRKGGLDIFPRLSTGARELVGEFTQLSTGQKQLDQLLGGGIEKSTSTLILGPAGTGKSSVASQFAANAAEKGIKAALFVFDESAATLLNRCDGIGIGLRKLCEEGAASITQVDPADLSPGELIHNICRAVEEDDVGIVVIDSLNGYLNAMPDEKNLIIQLHELLNFLGQAGVATILIAAHQGLIGARMTSPIDASYLADSVILMRHFESEGVVRQAISVMKKRGGLHERTVREFSFTSQGIVVGEILRNFQGVLSGAPILAPVVVARQTDE